MRKSIKIREIEGERWREEKCDERGRGLSLDRVRIKISSVLFFPPFLLFWSKRGCEGRGALHPALHVYCSRQIGAHTHTALQQPWPNTLHLCCFLSEQRRLIMLIRRNNDISKYIGHFLTQTRLHSSHIFW